METTQILVQAFVTSHLDYCNALLHGIPKHQMGKLQKIQNQCARLITMTKARDHITPVLIDLHWLPIEQRITYKIATTVYKALNGMAPEYLAELLQPHKPARPLRSENKCLLSTRVPRTLLGEKAFSINGPKVWNLLPIDVKISPVIESFKSNLKTHLFRKAFAGRL